MGGRALKLAYTRRYEKKEFLALKDEMIKILDRDFKFKTVPLYYRDKETFGDLDIIITWAPGNVENGSALRSYIEDTFNPLEIYHTKNSNSWSFDYKECQVDFIMCAEEDFWTYYHYFSYNDLGNFIGVLARNLGLKYGQEGLFYDHYFKNKNVGRISVSKDYRRIFEFLDLDYTRFMRGFDNMEEIFDFVASSKYYNYEFYQLSNLNKINRERNVKRASYMSLLEYIDKNHKRTTFEYVKDKTPYIQKAAEFFPEFKYKEETRRMEYEEVSKLYVSSKLNGDMVREEFGIDGKELGEVMMKTKRHFAENYDRWVIESPKENILFFIKKMFIESI